MKNLLRYVGIFFFFLILCFAFLNYNNKIENQIQKSKTDQWIEQKNGNYIIDRIVAYSNVYIESNEDNQRPNWQISAKQFTDFAIYIKSNKAKKTDETNIKEISIENIKIDEMPKIGIPTFNTIRLKDFGKLEISKEEISNGIIKFDVIKDSENIDENKLQFKNNGEFPLTFQYVNNEIVKDIIISDISKPLIYDASILKRINVPVDSLKSKISFNIKIVNELGEEYIAEIQTILPITEEIYNGSQTNQIEVDRKLQLII